LEPRLSIPSGEPGSLLLVPFFDEAPLELDVLLGMFALSWETRDRSNAACVAYPQFGCYRRAILESARRPGAYNMGRPPVTGTTAPEM
jgi:hypothetical protein